VLTKQLGAARSAAIMRALGSFYRQAARGGGVPFTSMGQFYTVSGMSATELSEVFDYITRSPGAKTGRVNLNTATIPVLTCLGLSQSDASALTAQQATATNTDHSWAFKALSPAGLASILNVITFHSYQYSADIVAVSGDGRAFKRVRIVVDGTKVPAKIVYRHDVTSLGWPLTDQLRQSMRAGQGITADMQGSGVGTPGLTIK
jgi:hypothetical protein